MQVLKKLTPIILIIGSYVYFYAIFLGIIQTPYLQEFTANGITIYRFDFANYFKNMSIGWTTYDAIQFVIPTREFNADIINNIALLFDWLYMPLNALLYIMKWFAYLLRNILQLLGLIPQTMTINGITYQPTPIIQMLNWIMSNMQIPYL